MTTAGESEKPRSENPTAPGATRTTERPHSKTTAPLTERIDALLWGINVSIRYHMRREGFFDRWHKVTNFVVIVSSSAAIVLFVQEQLAWQWAVPFISALVAVVAAAEQVVGTAPAARVHNALRRRFIELQTDIFRERADESIDEQRVVELECAKRLIDADEPPAYVALAVKSINEALVARYGPEGAEPKLHRLPLYKRATAQFFRWEGA